MKESYIISIVVFLLIGLLVFSCVNYNSIENYRRGGYRRPIGRGHIRHGHGHVRHGHRHGRWFGRHGGRFGGWGFWGRPYYAGLYTNYPPYLYDYAYHTPRCFPSNKKSDCDPGYVKIKKDTDNDGEHDLYKCCRYH